MLARWVAGWLVVHVELDDWAVDEPRAVSAVPLGDVMAWVASAVRSGVGLSVGLREGALGLGAPPLAVGDAGAVGVLSSRASRVKAGVTVLA